LHNRGHPHTSIWDRLDKVGRWQSADKRREAEHDTRAPWEPPEEEYYRADQSWSDTLEARLSERAEQEPHPEEPVPEDRKLTREEFMAKLDADERKFWSDQGRDIDPTGIEPKAQDDEPEEKNLTRDEFFAKIYEGEKDIWANDRRYVAKLFDEIEAERSRRPAFEPNFEQFFDQIDSRIIQLTKEEKERARDLGIDHERTRDQDYGLSYRL